MSNWGIVGHGWAVALLQNALKSGNPPRSLLLAGPSGIGKMSLALAWARAVNCLAPQVEERPCGECRSCRLQAAGRHPDVIHVEPEKDLVKIDQVRELERKLALSPVEGRWKIGILEQFDKANASAANALLKTLEEPPSRALLVLTAESTENLLPTIVSRCQVIRLRPLSRSKVAEALQEKWGANPTRAELLAKLSGGRIGWAVRALENPDFLMRRESFWQDMLEMTSADYADRLVYAEKLSERSELVPEWLDAWSGWWRDVLLLQSGFPNGVASEDKSEELTLFSSEVAREDLLDFLGRLQEARRMLRTNVNTRLLLENVLLHLPSIIRSRRAGARNGDVSSVKPRLG